MPPRPARDSRWLAGAALATATSLALAGCTAPDQPTRNRGGSALPPVASSEQPVRAPGPDDVVLPNRPLPTPEFQAPRTQPNLLMITVDDANQDDLRHMPNVQRLLADEGVDLTNGIAPTPICVPARASLITGQYAHNHGAVTISGAGGGYDYFDDEDTLPGWLQEAGYDTFFIGKYLNGYGADSAVPPGWTEWRGTEDPTTYNFVRPTVSVNGTSRTYHEYSTDVFSDLTVDFLDDPERAEKPWYMWVNYVAPHHGGPDAPDDPVNTHPDDPSPIKTTTPAQEDVDTFASLRLPDKPNMFEKDVSDKALIRSVRNEWPPSRRDQLVEAHQQRVESLQSVDRAVARTIDTLRESGQLDDTYVVFTSDNGYVLGEHNLDGKLWYFREIVGVPMLIRGPGLPRGETSSTPVTNADWAPTFAALAGATPGRAVDGVNVMPWLDREAPTRVVPIEGYPVAGGTRPLYTGVLAGHWTYVENRSGRSEVYYRDVDPWEDHSLRRDPRYQSQVRELAELTDRYADCAASTCPRDFYE
jgi:arylsulfatase A-like enzyme